MLNQRQFIFYKQWGVESSYNHMRSLLRKGLVDTKVLTCPVLYLYIYTHTAAFAWISTLMCVSVGNMLTSPVTSRHPAAACSSDQSAVSTLSCVRCRVHLRNYLLYLHYIYCIYTISNISTLYLLYLH